MVVSSKYFYYLCFLFILLRPTFYYYSVTYARISDFMAFILMFFCLLYISRGYIPKVLLMFWIWMLIDLIIISFSLFINSLQYILCIKDFFELIRPISIFFAISLGFFYSKNFGITELMKLIVFTGNINALIGSLEFFFNFNLPYLIFSTPNLLLQQRAGGIVYSHIEYSLFNVLISTISLYLFLITKQKKYILLTLFLITTSVFSLSKSGLVYLISVYFLILVFFFRDFKLKGKILIAGFFVFLMAFVGYIITSFGYFKYGFEALINIYSTTNISILNRLEDINIVINTLQQGDYRFFIGSSPLRLYPDISYIEISFFNILFRFGIIGAFLYYFILFLPFYVKKPKSKELLMLLKIMRSISMATFLVDFTGNASENIKFSFLLFYMYGLILGEKRNEKNTSLNQ